MRRAYGTVAHVIALGVVVQAASIAWAVFAVSRRLDNGGDITKDSSVGGVGFAIHGIVGEMVMPALGIVLVILALVARFPGAVSWAAIVLGAVILQIVFAFVSGAVPIVGLLHGINALIVLGVSLWAGRRAMVVSTARPGRGQPVTP